MRKDVSFLLLVDPQVDHKILVHAVPALLKIQFMNGSRGKEREREQFIILFISLSFLFRRGSFSQAANRVKAFSERGARRKLEFSGVRESWQN
jgi:hypothetical protein